MNGVNSTFIGIPHSAKSGYLRFMLQEKKLLSEIVGDTEVVFINPLSTDSPIEAFSRSLDVKCNINSIVEYLSKFERVIIVLYRTQYWISLNDLYVQDFRCLYDSVRQNTQSISYLFLAEETNPFQKFNTPFVRFFRGQFQEFIDYFPLMDKEEWDYTVKRLCIMNSKAIPDNYEELWNLTDGIYPLVKSTVMEFSEKTLDMNVLYKSPQVQNTLKYLVDLVDNESTKMLYNDLVGIGIIDEEGIYKGCWLNRALNEKMPKDLTQNEERILTVLKGNIGEVVSRDVIAKCIWGSKYLENYSEWAIEKVISRIRNKLKLQSSELSIITYKGEGYGIDKHN